MSTLGNQTLGFTFSVSGSFGQAAGGPYTVPSPGIFLSQINVYAGNNGSSSTDRLYIWQDSSGHAGVWLLRSGTFGMGGDAWQRRSDINVNTAHLSSDGYLPAGTKIWIGLNASTGILDYQGAGSGTTDIGNTGDGDFNFHSTAGGGMGVLGAYVDYSPLAAPNLTSVSPGTAAAGQTVTLTGSHLLHTTGITVCGVTASTYTINSDTSITLTIPSGAAGTGTIVLTTPAGSDSLSFTAGSLYADNGSAFAGGVTVYADNGSAWQQAQVWADTGTSWVQIG